MTDALSPERIETLRYHVAHSGDDFGTAETTLDALLAERSRNAPIVEAAKRWAEEWTFQAYRPHHYTELMLYDAVTAAGKGGG